MLTILLIITYLIGLGVVLTQELSFNVKLVLFLVSPLTVFIYVGIIIGLNFEAIESDVNGDTKVGSE